MSAGAVAPVEGGGVPSGPPGLPGEGPGRAATADTGAPAGSAAAGGRRRRLPRPGPLQGVEKRRQPGGSSGRRRREVPGNRTVAAEVGGGGGCTDRERKEVVCRRVGSKYREGFQTRDNAILAVDFLLFTLLWCHAQCSCHSATCESPVRVCSLHHHPSVHPLCADSTPMSAFQLSYIDQILKNPDVFCLADFQCYMVDVTQLKVPPEKDNKELNTW